MKHNGLAGAGAGFLARTDISLGMRVEGLAAADLNGDQRLDLAVGGFMDSTVRFLSILINDGNGGFGAPVAYEAAPGASQNPSSTAVALRDLDGDGDADLLGGGLYAAGGSDVHGAITVRRNDGQGAFGGHVAYTYGSYVPSPHTLTTGDVNGDGFADVIATTPTGPRLFVFRNDGNQSFPLVTTLVPGGLARGIAGADTQPDPLKQCRPVWPVIQPRCRLDVTHGGSQSRNCLTPTGGNGCGSPQKARSRFPRISAAAWGSSRTPR